MNALIVLAHPEPASFNAALKDVAVRTLHDAGWGVEVSDLYAQHFGAVAGKGDFTRLANPDRFGLVHEQRHAIPGEGYAPDIRKEQERVRRADLIVFQFPVWWYGVPAILKGWADRVLAHGFAYTDDRLFETGLLRGKSAMVSFTTGGTRAELDADSGITGTVEEFLRPFTGGVLRYTGMEVLPAFGAYAPAALPPPEREAELARYRAHLEAVLAAYA